MPSHCCHAVQDTMLQKPTLFFSSQHTMIQYSVDVLVLVARGMLSSSHLSSNWKEERPVITMEGEDGILVIMIINVVDEARTVEEQHSTWEPNFSMSNYLSSPPPQQKVILCFLHHLIFLGFSRAHDPKPPNFDSEDLPMDMWTYSQTTMSSFVDDTSCLENGSRCRPPMHILVIVAISHLYVNCKHSFYTVHPF